MKKIIAASAIALVALAGCASTESQEGPAPAPTVTETASESLTDLLLPPSATTTLEPIQGLLPLTSDQSPQFIWEQVDLPEVENLPPLPGV